MLGQGGHQPVDDGAADLELAGQLGHRDPGGAPVRDQTEQSQPPVESLGSLASDCHRPISTRSRHGRKPGADAKASLLLHVILDGMQLLLLLLAIVVVLALLSFAVLAIKWLLLIALVVL